MRAIFRICRGQFKRNFQHDDYPIESFENTILFTFTYNRFIISKTLDVIILSKTLINTELIMKNE